MLELKIEAYQFFSRTSFPLGKAWSIKASSVERPELLLSLTFEHVPKPFDMAFAQLIPKRPTIGASQVVDTELDSYFLQRWPTCLSAKGVVHLPVGQSDLTSDARCETLYFIRRLLWELPGGIPNPAIPIDQRASMLGYRREFTHFQLFDILGIRRPCDMATFATSEIGEPIGPGVATILEWQLDVVNELVWSPILPFSDRSTVEHDKEAIRSALWALTRHYNSYSELRDARRHLERSEIKGAVRSAASALDAWLLHIRQALDLPSPPAWLPYDQKIEHVLALAGRSSYQELEPIHSKRLLYLYRARSSMHEGDCVYVQDDGVTVRVREIAQALQFVESAEAFVLWADSYV